MAILRQPAKRLDRRIMSDADADELWGRTEAAQFDYAVLKGASAVTLTALQGRDACEGSPAFPSHGHCVWDAALLLADLLQASGERFANTKTVELGAGVGLVGMALAVLGAEVVLTDQAYTLPLLRRNVQRNFVDRELPGVQAPKVEACQWGELIEGETLRRWADDKAVDLVVFSDVTYNAEAARLLVHTLGKVANPDTVVHFSYETRSAEIETGFLKALDDAGFDVHQVSKDDYASVFDKYEYPDELFAFCARKRPT